MIALSPRTLDDALRLRAEHPDATVLAGGTDLMVELATGHRRPAAVLDLWRCDELRGIAREPDGAVRIGALTTWAELAESSLPPEVVRECARTIGARQIQNRGTVGGNIVNASPAGDSLVVWLALDAVFEVASARGVRRVPAERFFQGYRKVDLARDELLVAVRVPESRGCRVTYRKVGPRRAQAISKVVFCGRIRLRDGRVNLARVALGAVAPTPVRCRSVEEALVGRAPDPAAADRVRRDIRPIDDVRSTAAYREQVARNLVRRWLETVAAGAAA